MAANSLVPDGLVAVVKRDCPTCTLVAPVLAELAGGRALAAVVSQDDPSFPPGVDDVVDDRALDLSWSLGIDTVPTLLRVEEGREVARLEGWRRREWESFVGVSPLGEGLPDYRPGCGSRTAEPGVAEQLAVRHGASRLRSRRIELGPLEDEAEAMYDRGWTDGLPVVTPTEGRVLRMLEGTTRAPDEVVAVVPPDLVECTVEKAAVNAVLAGCRPEYLPVVLAAVEAACTDEFNIHGLLATTWFSGPVVVVNGPVARAVGMNSGINALGQGNRANATIGRALQLVVRNVGGGRPGQVDRAALGNPGKYTFCFAEDEDGSPWEPLAVERGVPAGASAVTLFGGGGVQGLADQRSRDPESLAATIGAALGPGAGWDAMLVVTPEHARVFREGGWDKPRLRSALGRPGLLIVHAGGRAGMFSAIIGGWVSGPMGSQPVTREVRT